MGDLACSKHFGFQICELMCKPVHARFVTAICSCLFLPSLHLFSVLPSPPPPHSPPPVQGLDEE